MQTLAQNGDVSNSLHFFDMLRIMPGKPSIYDYNALLNCYLKSSNVCLDGINVLQLEMKRVGLSPNVLTFSTLLKGLSIVGEAKVGLGVVLEMCDYGFVPSFSCLANLFRRFLDEMELGDAISVLELMLRFSYVPTEPKVILLISSLCGRGMIRDACVVYFKVLDKGCFQSPYFYNPILWSLCKSDQIGGLLAFFCCLEKKGLVYNVCSYTALVYGFSKKGLFREAYKIIEGDSGCHPNVKTYTTIIKGLCEYGRIKEALGLLGKMEKNGCDPDIVTYNIVMRALSNENMVNEIYELYESLHQKGLVPDRYTATALSGLLKRGSLGIARTLLQDIFLSDIDLDVAVYNVYLYSLCHAREPQELSMLVRSMIKNGIEPNNITFNTILKGFCEEKTLDEALEFFEHVDWPGKRPDLVSFNTILSAACKMGDSRTVQKVVDLMDGEGFKLNVVGLTCLMQYFCKVGKFDDCLKVFEHMIIYGPRPSVVTVNTLLVYLCKNHEVEAAYWVIRNLKRYGLLPNSRTYHILIRGAKSERKFLLVGTAVMAITAQIFKPRFDKRSRFDDHALWSWRIRCRRLTLRSDIHFDAPAQELLCFLHENVTCMYLLFLRKLEPAFCKLNVDLNEPKDSSKTGKVAQNVEVKADNESEEEESDTEGNDTSGSDSEDLDYDPKHDDVFDDDEHIVEEVHVNMNNFSFTTDPKHDTSIGDVDVQEDDLDIIDYDSFGSDLDDGIDSERRIQLRELRRIGKQKTRVTINHVIKSLATNPDIPVRAVQDQMQKQFEVGVSKKRDFRAKRIAYDIMTGSYIEQYSLLREYAQELINQNPGTTVRIDVQQEPNPESLTRIFKRVYVCLGALKQGFKACGREILGLDGYFMSSPWSGQILTAVGVDANNEIYPVAYAIVEAETKATSEGEFKKKMGELKSFNSDAYDWLMKIPLEKWSRAYFLGIAKCDLLINNICEVFNRQLIDGRDQPM
ncbi:pentatricopeptide repeat-containing protein [Tanacetum coccineum]